MTKVQQRLGALLAVIVLAAGCALAAIPQQSADAKVYQLASGSTFARATNLPYSTLKSLTVTNKATFNTTNDNNFYKFTTSNRNSTYKIRLNSYSGDYIHIEVYDSGHHRFYSFGGTNLNKAYTLKKLKRNSTYYIEVWRYAVDSQYYIDTYSKSSDQGRYAEYKLTLKEVVTKPKAIDGWAASKSRDQIRVRFKFERSFDADGYQILYKRGTSWSTDKTDYKRYSKANFYKFSVKGGSGKEYTVKVRPFRDVNGKKYFARWARYGKVVNSVYASNSSWSKKNEKKSGSKYLSDYAFDNETQQFVLYGKYKKSSGKYKKVYSGSTSALKKSKGKVVLYNVASTRTVV